MSDVRHPKRWKPTTRNPKSTRSGSADLRWTVVELLEVQDLRNRLHLVPYLQVFVVPHIVFGWQNMESEVAQP